MTARWIACFIRVSMPSFSVKVELGQPVVERLDVGIQRANRIQPALLQVEADGMRRGELTYAREVARGLDLDASLLEGLVFGHRAALRAKVSVPSKDRAGKKGTPMAAALKRTASV